MDETIFKAYDIRGVYPGQLDEKMAYDIARGYATLLLGENRKVHTIALGRDMRISSPSLSKEVIRGLVDSGLDVIDFGLISTPTFYFAVGKLGLDGGLQVSASHNPKEYNGIKIVKSKSYPVGLANGIDKIRDCIKDKSYIALGKKGDVKTNDSILKEAVDYSMKFYDFKVGKLKIVADVANAMSAPDLRALFERLDCELIEMNFELDGTFPAHQADPLQEKNTIDIRKKVIETKADLGIATDGDGDRFFFIDDKGEMIDPSIIRGILSKVVLEHNPGSDIGYDIRPGMITRDMIIENGGKPFITKVGHSLIKIEAIKHDAPFSGESSGHFFFRSEYGTFEMPLVTTLIILDLLSRSKKRISDLIEPFKRYYHSGEINRKVNDPKQILKELEARYGKDGKILKIDGIYIEHKDWWFNVRTSNTEPLIRLNLEARSKDLMEEKRDEILDLL